MPLYLRASCVKIRVINAMLFQIKSYLKFLWHSKMSMPCTPLSYSLWLLNVFDRKQNQVPSSKDYRKALLANKKTIEVTDFGRVLKSSHQTKKISRIAMTAGITQKELNYYSNHHLFWTWYYFRNWYVFRLGNCCLGLSSKSIGKNAKIVTLEGCQKRVQLKIQLQNSIWTI
jgi:hypothetical protein